MNPAQWIVSIGLFALLGTACATTGRGAGTNIGYVASSLSGPQLVQVDVQDRATVDLFIGGSYVGEAPGILWLSPSVGPGVSLTLFAYSQDGCQWGMTDILFDQPIGGVIPYSFGPTPSIYVELIREKGCGRKTLTPASTVTPGVKPDPKAPATAPVPQKTKKKRR